jgi:hypothetical protein
MLQSTETQLMFHTRSDEKYAKQETNIKQTENFSWFILQP